MDEVNEQLDKMGYNIGIRVIDEFLAKSRIQRCRDFAETMDVLAKVGIKMFLGVGAEVTNWSADGQTCSVILGENPITGASRVVQANVCGVGCDSGCAVGCAVGCVVSVFLVGGVWESGRLYRVSFGGEARRRARKGGLGGGTMACYGVLWRAMA